MKKVRDCSHLETRSFQSREDFAFEGEPWKVSVQQIHIRYHTNDGRIWTEIDQIPRNLKFTVQVQMVMKQEYKIEEFR